jgi:hypothetical protein
VRIPYGQGRFKEMLSENSSSKITSVKGQNQKEGVNYFENQW